MSFRILWGLDAAIALIFLYFFFAGLADGSISSFNIGLWLLILLAIATILGGGYGLRAAVIRASRRRCLRCLLRRARSTGCSLRSSSSPASLGTEPSVYHRWVSSFRRCLRSIGSR